MINVDPPKIVLRRSPIKQYLFFVGVKLAAKRHHPFGNINHHLDHIAKSALAQFFNFPFRDSIRDDDAILFHMLGCYHKPRKTKTSKKRAHPTHEALTSPAV